MSEKIVQLNEAVIKSELKELVRGSVEETLNELLEAEAEKLTERNEQHQGYRSGHYSRSLTTTSGNVTLNSKAFLLRLLLLSSIDAVRAAWKRPSLRCTWQECRCGEWRTSPRRCGAARSLPPPSVS